jgi:hypothetical protein
MSGVAVPGTRQHPVGNGLAQEMAPIGKYQAVARINNVRLFCQVLMLSLRDYKIRYGLHRPVEYSDDIETDFFGPGRAVNPSPFVKRRILEKQKEIRFAFLPTELPISPINMKAQFPRGLVEPM